MKKDSSKMISGIKRKRERHGKEIAGQVVTEVGVVHYKFKDSPTISATTNKALKKRIHNPEIIIISCVH